MVTPTADRGMVRSASTLWREEQWRKAGGTSGTRDGQ